MNWGVFGLGLVDFGQSRLAKRVQLRAFSIGPFTGSITGISSARSLTVSRESFEVTVSGGSTLARVKLKEIDGMAPQDVERAV